MKKGEIYEGIIEKVDFPNKGRVVAEGKTVTVKNGIPGQKVRFFDQQKERRPPGGKAPGSAGKISSGKAGTSVQYFSGLRRLYVSDNGV